MHVVRRHCRVFSLSSYGGEGWGEEAVSPQMPRGSWGGAFVAVAVVLTRCALWQWLLLGCGAFLTGLSKTGITGLGVLTVACFANALPARESTGALLPLLLCGDVFGVAFFRKHASWSHLWRLLPWVVLGVGAGSLALGRVSNQQVQRLIGGILLLMVGLHYWQRRRANPEAAPVAHGWEVQALIGLLAGFTTMMANAAGPVMGIYLLAVGLPKLVFVGTTAWFFMLVNALKVPFSLSLGLINGASLHVDALLLPLMVPGALLGPVLLKRLNQKAFERMVLVLTVAAALRLLWYH
jgi:uncharacterized membrane protein YfcA